MSKPDILESIDQAKEELGPILGERSGELHAKRLEAVDPQRIQVLYNRLSALPISCVVGALVGALASLDEDEVQSKLNLLEDRALPGLSYDSLCFLQESERFNKVVLSLLMEER